MLITLGQRLITSSLMAAALLLPFGLAHAQQTVVPERFVSSYQDTDLPGNDIRMLPDITYSGCQAACLATGECAAFTFNAEAQVCFLKSEVAEAVPFANAFSGVVHSTEPAVFAYEAEALELLTFVGDYDLEQAREQARRLAARYASNGATEDEIRARGGDFYAEPVTGPAAAIVTVADSGSAWLDYARALLATANGDTKYDTARQAYYASINAAVRLPALQRAEALVTMADALQVTSGGRSAYAALRAADELVPGIGGERYEELRDSYGFRLLAAEPETVSSSPRVCLSFSETLVDGADYDPYVARQANLGLELDGQRICVTGVQYGETYTFTLRAGLPAANGEELRQHIPVEVYVRDRDPVVTFPGRAYVLPATGTRALPVETINVADLDLTLLRVPETNVVRLIREDDFLAAMDSWSADRLEQESAEAVWTGHMRVSGELNETTTTRIPLDDVPDVGPGLYVMRADLAGNDSYYPPPALQWFLVTDLGVTTLSGNDGVHAVVQRLSDGSAVPGATVSLVARSNRQLGTATTDEQGHARFAAALALGPANSAPALLTVEADGDVTLISLTDPEYDLSDRGVAGRSESGPIDVFVTSDRGVYRPGETVHLTALARDQQAHGIPGLPLTVTLLRPDGAQYSREALTGDTGGGYVHDVRLGPDVPLGAWRVELHSDPTAPALARYPLLVEEFVPDRIEFDLALTGAGPIDLRLPPSATVAARYLFGPPAADLRVGGTLTLRPTTTLEGWDGYEFGRHDQSVATQRADLAADVTTDAAGNATLALPTQRFETGARPYEATVVATVMDGAARPVERTVTRAVKPTSPLVGIRPHVDGALPEGTEATFDLIVVGPDGEAVSGDVAWRIDRVVTRYQWYVVDSRWQWEPVTARETVASGVAAVGEQPAQVSARVEWGRYEIRAELQADTHGEPVASSIEFQAGWASAATDRETPDLLDVALDKGEYRPGDTATLRLDPTDDTPGVALVTVLAGSVIDLRLVEVTGETTVELPVTDEWGAGAYVTASLIHPSDGPEHLPSRSLGVTHAAVDPGARVLGVELLTEAEVRSNSELAVELRVTGADGDAPATAFATVAAVDVGVLGVTLFESPDPAGYYFDQRRLGVGIRDVYGRLIDPRGGAMGAVRSGGDGGVEASPGPVPVQDVLALFSGPVTLDDGAATVTFSLPAFDGTVRLMAVAWTEDAVGAASEDVLVRDPVVVQASLPRFMTPGDVSRLRVELTLVDGAPGEAQLVVSGHGIGDAPSTLTLAREARQVVDVSLEPTEVGTHTYTVTVTSPDSDVIERELRLSVLDTAPETVVKRRVTLGAGEEFVLDDGALAGFVPSSADVTVGASMGAAIDLPGALLATERGSYRSTLQSAARIGSLVRARDDLVGLGLVSAADVARELQGEVDFLVTRQWRDGTFGLFGVGGYDIWLDAYATEALLLAEEAHADVPEEALSMALANLRSVASYAGSLSGDAAGYAHVFYALARAGEAAIGDLRYYADALPEKFDTPLAAAHLGAALALYGDMARADEMFVRAGEMLGADPGDLSDFSGDHGTVLRDFAAVLALGTESRTNVLDTVYLVTQAAEGSNSSRLSSQEAAWLVRAAVALGGAVDGLLVDGQPVTGRLLLRYEGEPVTLTNDGDETVHLTLTTTGVPSTPPPAVGDGYRVARSYYSLDGAPVDVTDPAAVSVGDLLVAVVTVTPDPGSEGGRLMIDAALPAGLEVENATLLETGSVKGLGWLDLVSNAEFVQARAERYLAVIERYDDASFKVAFVTRAVAAGTFAAPAALVTDVYRPSQRAVTASGTLTISE